MKRCFACGVEKPLAEFYTHPNMTDGHLNKCKDCTRMDVKKNRQTNPRVREYDRARASQPHRVALRRRVSAEWKADNPGRRAAVNAANNAQRDGRISPRPKVCEVCGLDKPLSKHHHDYAKPLAVIWVCKPCHAIADKLRRLVEKVAS